jgi:hypothetical protein
LISLREGNGRVPILTGHPDSPVILVDFPSQAEFADLYGKRVSAESRERYYAMLIARSQGATLSDAGKLSGVTRERVRQVEAKFLRLMRQRVAAIA